MSDVNLHDLWKTIESLNADQLTTVEAYVRAARLRQNGNGTNHHVPSDETLEERTARVDAFIESIRHINDGMTEEQQAAFDFAVNYKEPFDEEEFEELFGWIDDLPEDQR